MIECPFPSCKGVECVDYGQHIRDEHPIDCKELRDKALAYAQGKLEQCDEDRIDFHLRDCKACLRAAERIWKKAQEVTDGQSSVETETSNGKALL